MSVRTIKAGTTDVSVIVRIVDSADGTPETGVVFNTSGIDLWYRREGAASTDITEATLSALTDAHSDGGFLHVNDGWYRFDLPDAACASGVTGVQIGGTVTGMVVLAPYIALVAYDPYDTVRLGLTALPNAAAAASGGLFIRGTGAGAINQDANGRIDVNPVAWLGTAAATPTVAGVPEVDITHVNGTTAPAVRLALSAAQIVLFTVDTAGFTPTNVAFETSTITEATADHYKDRVIIWTTGSLAGQQQGISAYALTSGRGHFTLTPGTEAAANGDTGIIV